MGGSAKIVRSLHAVLFCLLFALQSNVRAELTEEESAIDAEIQRTWARFLGKLADNDAAGAANFIRPALRKSYMESFESMGDQLRSLTTDWSGIKAVSFAEPFAEYTVFQGDGENERLHIITFARSDDGLWIIYSL